MNIRDLFSNLDRSAIEKWCRAQTQVVYLGDHRALCRVLGKYLMYVDTRDLSLSPHMMMNGFWEMWVTQTIVDYVKPGMRCIDVGANCGYYTLLLADLAGDKFVDCIEPQTAAEKLLVPTLVVNGFGDVAFLRFAASDTSGEVRKLYVKTELMGSAALVPSGVLKEQEKTVVTGRIDGCRDVVDFVKIDVQGHELQVLAGMSGTIARSPKIAIAMEFSPAEHESPAAALETIRAMGLRIQAIGTDGQVRPVSLEDAAKPDTGDHRMLWLTREA